MTEHIVHELALILVLGVAAQWISWRVKAPSILLLLIIGFFTGPVLGWIHPDALLGKALTPIISLSVAVILFEGGLGLRFSQLRKVGGALGSLIIIGGLVTWAGAAAGAHYLLGFSLQMSVLLGAILMVSGPTVIEPLLRHVRPGRRVASILKWEGILIDPAGAVLAVLVYEAIVSGGFRAGWMTAAAGLLKTVLSGGVFGILGATVLILLLKRRWAPYFLHSPLTLMGVLSVYVLCNHIQPESGLLGVTVMAIALANQRLVAVRHIVEFKENLRVLLLSVLFILLAARIELNAIKNMSWPELAYLALLILIIRPLSVAVSTPTSGLSWRERAMLAWVYPRGIVCAAVASIFSLRLVEQGYDNAARLVPIAFCVIIGTVIVYGITASTAARTLGVAQTPPQGVLFAGADNWVRSLAGLLKEKGLAVLLIDTNPINIRKARMMGLPTHLGSVLSEDILHDLDLDGVGYLLAVTPNDEANALAGMHFAEVFDRAHIFQLVPDRTSETEEEAARHLRGRYLFDKSATYSELQRRVVQGAEIRATPISGEFSLDDYLDRHGSGALPLMVLSRAGRLSVLVAGAPVEAVAGDTLISLAVSETVREV